MTNAPSPSGNNRTVHPARTLGDQKGQAVTEAVLVMIMVLGVTFTASSYFKNNEVLKRLVKGPFTFLAGMLQNGSWAPADQGAAGHPTAHVRHIVILGDPPR